MWAFLFYSSTFFTNILRKHLVLKISKHWIYVKKFPQCWEDEGFICLGFICYSTVEDQSKYVTFPLVFLRSQDRLPNQWVFWSVQWCLNQPFVWVLFPFWFKFMWNLTDRGNNWLNIVFYFNMMSCIQRPYFSKPIMKP